MTDCAHIAEDDTDPPDPQDPGYSSQTTNGQYQQAATALGLIPFMSPYPERAFPDNYQTCYRACLCSYYANYQIFESFTSKQITLGPYDSCNCIHGKLSAIYFHLLNAEVLRDVIVQTVDDLNSVNVTYDIPLTPTNPTLFKIWNVSETPNTTTDVFFGVNGINLPLRFYDISEGDSRTVVRPFECFGDLDLSQANMANCINITSIVLQMVDLGAY